MARKQTEKAPRETSRGWRHVSASEIAWAAGLFEGEGSIVITGRAVRLQLKMTDEDVVRHLHDIAGGRVHGPYSYPTQADGSERMPYWVWIADGQRAHTVARMMEPWLGKRRRAKMEALGLFGQGTLPFD